jgi:hypothetical protein
VSDDTYELGVPGGALNLNYTGYPDHGRYGDLPLQGKIHTAEPGIEPKTSWLVVRSSDHQATRLVTNIKSITRIPVKLQENSAKLLGELVFISECLIGFVSYTGLNSD